MSAVINFVEIDDEPKKTVLSESYLNELGAHRESAESLAEGRSVLRQLSTSKFGDRAKIVAILDLMFPANFDLVEGLALITEVRRGELDIHPDTPIVVHSKAGDRSTRERALGLGADAFHKKIGDPRPFLDDLAFYAGKERVTSTVVCEVYEVDLFERWVAGRIRGEDGWVAERRLALDMCPRAARFAGGAFYLDTVEQFEDFSRQQTLKSRPFAPSEDREFQQELFGGDPDDA